VTSCGRCGVEDRPDRLRLSLVNLAREARQDGRQHTGPDYANEVRCRDREACSERARRTPPPEAIP
jgi:hypothetical protein